MIYVLAKKASLEQVGEMLESLGSYIKLAADIERGVLAG